MRRFRWILLIAELVMLAVVAVVPPVDLPQTAFDEADTPINQATVPVVLSCRLTLTGLHSAAVSASPRIHPQPTRSATVDFHPQPSARSRSLLTLLCSFLC
jgi:hypothetical protein